MSRGKKGGRERGERIPVDDAVQALERAVRGLLDLILLPVLADEVGNVCFGGREGGREGWREGEMG